MNQPVRRKTDAGRNEHESIGRDRDILWKTFILSSHHLYATSIVETWPRKGGIFLPTHSQVMLCHGCSALRRTSKIAVADTALAKAGREKRKTRPGGQPDGSSHMGAWGGWALAPNIASMGRNYRSHIGLVAGDAPDVQGAFGNF
jgi:hypothetical protein